MNPKKPVADGEPADDSEPDTGHEVAATDSPQKPASPPKPDAAGPRKPEPTAKPDTKPQIKAKPKPDADGDSAQKPAEKTLADIMKFDLKIRRPRR
jgi:hypothetical protein